MPKHSSFKDHADLGSICCLLWPLTVLCLLVFETGVTVELKGL